MLGCKAETMSGIEISWSTCGVGDTGVRMIVRAHPWKWFRWCSVQIALFLAVVVRCQQ